MWWRTELRPLKHLQLCMRIQQSLNCLDILLVLESGEKGEVL
jgi:hypothetical protein